jgi:hypothetical protein
MSRLTKTGLLFSILTALPIGPADSFAVPPIGNDAGWGTNRQRQVEEHTRVGPLYSLNMFGQFGDFLNWGQNNRTNTIANGNDDASDSDMAAGTLRLIELPVHDIKAGGLRLFLMFFLMGLQNTPEPKTWKADQPSTEEYVLDFWFHDQTAVLSIELSNNAIILDRVGSAPSMQYLLQEAVVVESILDELERCANDDSVAQNDRLLRLKEQDAIERARDTLAFG